MTPSQKKVFSQGTPFQQIVWRELQKIPKGQTRNYEDIARAIGRPKAVRAVANAIGANTLPQIIPCHRVIRKDGKIGGYRFGIQKKIRLLKDEGIEF